MNYWHGSEKLVSHSTEGILKRMDSIGFTFIVNSLVFGLGSKWRAARPRRTPSVDTFKSEQDALPRLSRGSNQFLHSHSQSVDPSKTVRVNKVSAIHGSECGYA